MSWTFSALLLSGNANGQKAKAKFINFALCEELRNLDGIFFH
jgi:hypothetical protein